MTVRSRGRSGRPWERAKAHVRATQPNCWLCGLPVDLTLDRHSHPLGSTVDHKIPLEAGGPELDPTNLGHAHRICGALKGISLATPEVKALCRTRVLTLLGPTEPPSRTW